LGVGSDLRGDDAAGVLIAQNLCKTHPKNKKVQFQVIIGGTAPESLTGEIKRFSPTHLVIIDAADMNKKPGATALLNPEEAAGISFSTHQLPLKIMIDYLLKSISCQISVIGIQPKTLAFGAPCSPEVAQAGKSISDIFKGILKG
jgi:hydrogenase 3 maturation protease